VLKVGHFLHTIHVSVAIQLAAVAFHDEELKGVGCKLCFFCQLSSAQETDSWLSSWASADGPFQRFLLCAWRVADRDGNGTLSLKETKRMAVKLLQGTSKVQHDKSRLPLLPTFPLS
jgi:hypothetical protein